MSLTIVITSYLEPEHVERIRQTAPEARVLYDPALLPPPRYVSDHNGPADFRRSPEDEERYRAWLAEADILFDLDRRLGTRLPELAPRVRWIQSTSSGIGKLIEQMELDRTDIVITNAAGVHAVPLAEHSLLAMLYFCKQVPEQQRKQRAHRWERYCGRELRGRTLTVIGLGAVGTEIARLARAAGLRVLGVKRSPVRDPALLPVDAVLLQPDLHEALRESDFVVLICPHTAETEGMMGAEEFARMPQGAVLINIGRGALVQEDALIDALVSGRLGGAALDVAATEPLPDDSPLWDLPNVLITSHSASTVDRENERLTALFCENLERFRAGEPLRNRLQG